MKVLLVVLHADASRGGAEGYTVTLFHRLLAEGHDARIAAATFEAGIPRDRRVPLQFRGATRLGRYGRFLRSLDEYVKANPDWVVHSMLPVRRCDIYQPQAGLEIVEWRRASMPQRLTNGRRRAFVAVEKKLLLGDRPPITVCLSEQTRKEAVHIFGRPEHFVTVYHAVDEAKFPPEPPRPPHSPPACVFVGQDFLRKGLSVAIRAIAFHPTLSLHVIGKDDPHRYKQLAARLKLGERVRFFGATRDVAARLRDADVMVFPTRREPFGMVGVEAMLCGVPVVVSANAGFAEIVRDGIDGRVVNGEAPGDWAAAIDDVLNRREQMSAACLARRDELSYSHHLRTLLSLYERIRAQRP
ncbi:MAG: glycosyltransferase family 4 protein [Tepidisphaeraceae bacterium]